MAENKARTPYTRLMMTLCKNITLISFFLIGSTMANLVQASSVVFTNEQLTTVKAKYQGKKWLMLLWSVDCPPCFTELAMVQKLNEQAKKSNGKLNIVLINTDDDEQMNAERQAIIQQFSLANIVNLHFGDGLADQSRYLVDPLWYGELPRSYFIDEQGKSYGKSGVIDKNTLKKWLN